MRNKLICSLSLGAALAFATAAQATGPAAPAPLPETSLVQKVHACHAICELGPAGWHYHIGPTCKRVTCGASPGGPYIWRCDGPRCGWWHPLLFRWR
jgi:hypothetical protein